MSTAALPDPIPDPEWPEFVRLVRQYCEAANRRIDAIDSHLAAHPEFPPLTDDDLRRLMAEHPYHARIIGKFRPDLVSPAEPTEARKPTTKKAKSSYGSSSIKRGRRTKVAMEEIRAALYRIAKRDQPTNVRGVYYQISSVEGLLDHVDKEYRTVCRLLTEMRRSGEIPYGWITDNTRWVRHATRYGSLEDALSATARSYRRSLWDRVPAYVEIWLEKESLAGVLHPVTDRWDVPLYVTRGYASLSYLYAAGESIRGRAHPTHIYYFGDWDPSGVNIGETIERELRNFSDGAEIVFKRVAITPDLIDAWHLPSRPTKRGTAHKKGDSRAERFAGESVELDAIAAPDLRALCEECIVAYLDLGEVQRIQIAERAERESLHAIAARFGGAS